jgi:SPP1 family predicted phage head-tail adaptor
MIGYNKNEIIGKMRERVILQNRVISQSDSGFQSETYSNIATLWTALDYKSGFEEEDADKIVSQQKINFTLRYNENITTNSRFVYRDSLYQIEKIDISNDRRFVFCTGVYRSSYTGSYELTIDVAASVNGSATISANVNSLLYLACQANASASTTATITKIIEVSSLVNANASLSGNINFVQKAQASLLATGTTTADLTVQAAASLLLDLYPDAAVAYSLRKLRTAYTGSAVRVRRSSDNTEQDIGFVAEELDTVSLLAFCGIGNGFVTTWYDQSGNANNATQTTQASQPQIVSSGVIIISNGEPTIDFNGTNSYLDGHWSSLFTSTTDNFALFNVLKFDVSDTLQIPFGVTDGTMIANGNLSNVLHAYSINSTSFHRVNGEITNYSTSISSEFGIINDNLLVYQKNGIVTNVYNNNILKATQNFTTTLLGNVPTNTSFFMRFGTNRGYLTHWFNGNMKEFIIYPTSQSINISAINSNINTHYGIY